MALFKVSAARVSVYALADFKASAVFALVYELAEAKVSAPTLNALASV